MPIRPSFLVALVLAAIAQPAGAESLESYTETLPGTDITFEMLPVPGGEVRLSVASDGGEPAECVVELPAFWIGKCEVTWAEYRRYMALDKAYSELQQLTTRRGEAATASALSAKPMLVGALGGDRTADAADLEVDAVTAPTPLYDPSTTYESGEAPELPAVTMTPFAARQYTKWLSSLTGQHYRLPSEAEWLHAAAVGEVSKDLDENDLDAVAWYTDNSDYVAQPVGGKQSNSRGLHDLLGNAAELVLDGARPEGRPELAGKHVGWQEAVAWPRTGDARFAKGGWYDAEAEEINYTARMLADDEEWKASDPNLPQSPWWYADYPATGIGFRVVRTVEPLSEELQRLVWDTADAAVIRAVAERLREGRGKIGPINEDLPAVLEELASPEVRALLK